MEYLPARQILVRNKSTQWFGTDCTMNLYRGCCHGCIYCDNRSECYHNEDFDTVRAKAGALELLRDELRRKTRPVLVGMGSMSDPYNPFERELKLTRRALMLLHAYGCGVAVATVEEALAARIEPGAPSPARRLGAVERLSQKGIFSGVLLMPVLPFLEDSEENVLHVVDAAADAGAKFIYPGFGMTLRDRQRGYYYKQLDRLWPGLREKYERRYGARYCCPSPWGKALWETFSGRCRERGLLYEMKHIVSAAKRPYTDSQLTFFDM